MYDELVNRLRREAVYLPEKFSKNAELLDVLMKAADAIKELSKPRWIPVSERLPEDECPVLVTYLGFHDHKPRANMLAYIDRDLGWCWWDDDIPGGVPCSVEITHWQPLPEPPKEE